MEIADLARIVDGAARSAFRLETLPRYVVPQEAEEFAAWRAGNAELQTPANSSWLAKVAERVASGVHWYRVHILDQPLSDYSRYEIWGYQANQAAGEQIYLLDRHTDPDLEQLREDFWLVDDQTVVRMIYDGDGHFVRPEPADDVGHYLGVRATALRHAEPLDAYIASRDLRLTA